MKKILCPVGVCNKPVWLEYDIDLNENENAYIIIKNQYLYNNESGRDVVINRIINNDLSGIPDRFVKVLSLIPKDEGYFTCCYDLAYDYDDLCQKRPDLKSRTGIFNKKEIVQYTSNDVFLGDAKITTSNADCKYLTNNELKSLFANSEVYPHLFNKQGFRVGYDGYLSRLPTESHQEVNATADTTT